MARVSIGSAIASIAKSILKMVRLITAPIIGIAVALPVSTFFFISYLVVETFNLAAADLRRKFAVGKQDVYYNPTLKAFAGYLLGAAVGIWTKYGAYPFTETLKDTFEDGENKLVKAGLDRGSRIAPDEIGQEFESLSKKGLKYVTKRGDNIESEGEDKESERLEDGDKKPEGLKDPKGERLDLDRGLEKEDKGSSRRL